MKHAYIFSILFLFFSCSKKDGSMSSPPPPPPPKDFSFKSSSVGNTSVSSNVYRGINPATTITLLFDGPVKNATIASGILINEIGGASFSVTTQLANGDSNIIVKPSAPLKYLFKIQSHHRHFVIISAGCSFKKCH